MTNQSERQTLPDVLPAGIEIVSIGVNPSLPSARAGYYFANPRNRFWRALNASGLLAEPVEPGPAAMATIAARDRIGFTDLVKRPSAMEKDLRAVDFRQGAQELAERLASTGARLLWFHGKTPYTRLRQALGGHPAPTEWGLQPVPIDGRRCFVTPNPSPANAAFSLAVLTEWYARLAALRNEICRG